MTADWQSLTALALVLLAALMLGLRLLRPRRCGGCGGCGRRKPAGKRP